MYLKYVATVRTGHATRSDKLAVQRRCATVTRRPAMDKRKMGFRRSSDSSRFRLRADHRGRCEDVIRSSRSAQGLIRAHFLASRSSVYRAIHFAIRSRHCSSNVVFIAGADRRQPRPAALLNRCLRQVTTANTRLHRACALEDCNAIPHPKQPLMNLPATRSLESAPTPSRARWNAWATGVMLSLHPRDGHRRRRGQARCPRGADRVGEALFDGDERTGNVDVVFGAQPVLPGRRPRMYPDIDGVA